MMAIGIANWSRADVITRTTAMNMMSVPIWEEADAMKKKYKIWYREWKAGH